MKEEGSVGPETHPLRLQEESSPSSQGKSLIPSGEERGEAQKFQPIITFQVTGAPRPSLQKHPKSRGRFQPGAPVLLLQESQGRARKLASFYLTGGNRQTQGQVTAGPSHSNWPGSGQYFGDDGLLILTPRYIHRLFSRRKTAEIKDKCSHRSCCIISSSGGI